MQQETGVQDICIKFKAETDPLALQILSPDLLECPRERTSPSLPYM